MEGHPAALDRTIDSQTCVKWPGGLDAIALAFGPLAGAIAIFTGRSLPARRESLKDQEDRALPVPPQMWIGRHLAALLDTAGPGW